MASRRDGPLLSLHDAGMGFAGRVVLADVELTIRPGEVHGLVGQNGCGKSTITKILAGVHAPAEGTRIVVGGTELSVPPTAAELLEHGVAFVHQDLGLLDEATVADNVTIARLESSSVLRRLDRGAQRRACQAVLDDLGLDLEPDARVRDLSPADRTRVGIARAIHAQAGRPGVLVLDEATGSLPVEALDVVHRLIGRVAARGGAVLMISHNLEEVLDVCTTVTVLRDGRVAGARLDTRSTTEAELMGLMLGRTVDAVTRREREPAPGPARLSVDGLAGGRLYASSFEIAAGEIVGFTGLEGSGFEDVPYLLAGAAAARSGTLTVDGSAVDLVTAGVTRILDLGVVLVPGDRAAAGLAVDETVGDNIALPYLRRRSGRRFLSRGWQNELSAQVIASLNVTPPDRRIEVRRLSGGNQQKVLLGKWISGDPAVVLLHEPTRAVDVGARSDVLRAVQAVATKGAAVVLASVDVANLVAVCDRILVVRGGEIVADLATGVYDEVIEAIYGEPLVGLGA